MGRDWHKGMDTIFEQDKHMMTFIEGIEKGETDFLLGVDVPTRVYKAKFGKNDEDNFFEASCSVYSRTISDIINEH